MGEKMKRFAIFRLKLWQAVEFVACLLITVLIFIEPQRIKNGVTDGLNLCAEVIVPSLFPFTIVALFLFKSGIIGFIGKVLSPVTKKLFHLDENTAGVVLLSFIAGYPIGAKLINELYENKCITAKRAETMLYYSVNGGPAFIVIAVGCGMLNNEKLGVILLFAHILASLIICFLLARFENEEPSAAVKIERESTLSSFVNATADSVTSMFSICSWVIVFSVIGVVIDIFFKSPELNTVLSCVAEVTTGIKKLAFSGTVPSVSFFLGFSGISIHMQVLSSLKNFKISYSVFLIMRVINGILSSVICTLILHFFPIGVDTFSSFGKNAEYSTASMSVPLFFALMLTSATFLAFCKSQRKK